MSRPNRHLDRAQWVCARPALPNYRVGEEVVIGVGQDQLRCRITGAAWEQHPPKWDPVLKQWTEEELTLTLAEIE
jgi:hypothetical protein